MTTSQRKFEIGILLLLVNGLFGWGALAFCSLIAIQTDLAQFHLIGLALYAASWVMLGLGFYLAGSEGIRYAHKRRKKLIVQFLHLFRISRKSSKTGKLDSSL